MKNERIKTGLEKLGVDNNFICAPGSELNKNALFALASSYEKRDTAAISPVTFVNRRTKDGKIDDVVLALTTHPTQFSDCLLTGARDYIPEDTIFTQREQVAIVTSFVTTFRNRVATELDNIIDYIANDIRIATDLDVYNYNSISNIWTKARTEESFADPIGCVIDVNSMDHVIIDLTELPVYGSYITEKTIAYVAAAYLSSLIDSLLARKLPTVDQLEYINNRIPDYAAILVAGMKNWLQLARYYASIVPANVSAANL